ARDTCVLLALATAALVLPSMARYAHSPAEPHVRALSDAVAVVLLLLFVLSLPAALRRHPVEGDPGDGDPGEGGAPEAPEQEPPRWPLWLAISLLTAASVAAALVSDWFDTALQPSIHTLHLSEAFA